MLGPSFKEVNREENLSKEDFSKNYLTPNIPVVIKDMAKSWPALSKWTPEYFKSSYGDNKVKVYNGSFSAPGKSYMSNARTMKFSDYLDSILNSGEDLRMFLYNIVSKAPELKNDVFLPKLMKGFSSKFLFLFFGPKGAETQIHYDIDLSHVFHTAILGKKTFYLFSQSENKYLYRHPFTIRSYVDVVNPDLEKFPKLAKASGYKVCLNPGETLFIPSGHWHHVVYDEAGYAISLRCVHQKLFKRLQGIYNILVMQMIDRLNNKLIPKKWFAWKESMAKRSAEESN